MHPEDLVVFPTNIFPIVLVACGDQLRSRVQVIGPSARARLRYRQNHECDTNGSGTAVPSTFSLRVAVL